VEPLQQWILARSPIVRKLEARDDPTAELPPSTEEKYLSRQVVLVGYGRVGRRIAQALTANQLPYVVVEQNREVVERLRSEGLMAVSGDASEPVVLVQAHIANARMLVIATPDTLNVRQMVNTARTLNPEIEIVVRTHSEAEAKLLESEHAGKIFLGEEELAQSMMRYVLERSTFAQRHT
jgi:CPA2 family monovalent cation:H+ antiporter-2